MPVCINREWRAAIEVPGKNENRAFGSLGGACKRSEVRLRVDEERDSVGDRRRAAILLDPKEAHRAPFTLRGSPGSLEKRSMRGRFVAIGQKNGRDEFRFQPFIQRL